MKTVLKNLPVTAKTTGDDVLAAVNAVAVNGTTAVWDKDFKYSAPSANVQGSIDGNIIIALGDNKDYFHAHKTLPINGSDADAAIDTDYTRWWINGGYEAATQVGDHFEYTNYIRATSSGSEEAYTDDILDGGWYLILFL